VGAENLCHQAIFMDHASGASAPEATEAVQVGDASWQRAQWRGLVQGAVRPVGVVKVLALAQHGHQVALFQINVRSASSPQAEDHPASGRTRTGPADAGTALLDKVAASTPR
jgi:hypothetical protein